MWSVIIRRRNKALPEIQCYAYVIWFFYKDSSVFFTLWTFDFYVLLSFPQQPRRSVQLARHRTGRNNDVAASVRRRWVARWHVRVRVRVRDAARRHAGRSLKGVEARQHLLVGSQQTRPVRGDFVERHFHGSMYSSAWPKFAVSTGLAMGQSGIPSEPLE